MKHAMELIGANRDPISWFKRGIQYDAKFTGFKVNLNNGIAMRCWNKITVFVYEDCKIDVIREIQRVAGQYGYQNVTVDKMERVG